jgi:hypothetical protein
LIASKIRVTPQKEKMLEKEGPETPPDSPLLDLSDAAVKKLIRSAKKRGYVTHDQINALLSSEEVKSEQIEDILAKFSEMGVDVVETEESEPALLPGLQIKVSRVGVSRGLGAGTGDDELTTHVRDVAIRSWRSLPPSWAAAATAAVKEIGGAALQPLGPGSPRRARLRLARAQKRSESG